MIRFVAVIQRALESLLLPQKLLILFVADSILLVASWFLAMNLRVDDWLALRDQSLWTTFLVAVPVAIGSFYALGLYRSTLRYVTMRAVPALVAGIVLFIAAMWTANLAFGVFVPRSVPFIFALLAVFSLAGIRLLYVGLHQLRLKQGKSAVIIYGAGEAGRQLAASLRRGRSYAPVAFVDDDTAIQRRHVLGIRVHPPADLADLVATLKVAVVLVAIPSAGRDRRRQIFARLEQISVPFMAIPGTADLVSGRGIANDIRHVPLEDLLGRDPVPPDAALLSANIRGRTVLVTGAGGSIGSELCRQALLQQPSRLVLLDQSEFALFDIDTELTTLATRLGAATTIVPVLASVLDRPRVASVLAAFKVDTIYHAAAYKHVPLVEMNIAEGVRNNVHGTLVLAEEAMRAGVAAFIHVSSDKAVRPTSIMGAAKRVSELVCQAFAANSLTTRFSMVRFGNVLGSSGSVVPLFREQIERGGPVTVTHPDMTRYFMTISEAAELVIQAGAMARGGEVFVLDMGEPVNIHQLARRMIQLSGFVPVEDDTTTPTGLEQIRIRITGIRPGEKLFEELLIDPRDEPTQHPRILKAHERSVDEAELRSGLAAIDSALVSGDIDRLVEAINRLPVGLAHQRLTVDPLFCLQREPT